MRFVSPEFTQFGLTLKGLLLKILREEVKSGGRVHKSYFEKNGYRYPINIYFFENDRETKKSTLGQFDSRSFSFVFWDKIIHAPPESLMDLMRHELAHFLVYLDHGMNVAAHGSEFLEICKLNGWGSAVASATVEVDVFFDDQVVQKRKVKKLLELARSCNVHEASLAMEKAQELTLKYQLEMNEEENLRVYVHPVIEAPRASNIWNIYSRILTNFQVAPILCREKNLSRLDVVGEQENILNACLIFNYLQEALESAWSEQTHLKGKKEKNSFARGFLTTIQAALDQKRKISLQSSSRELILRSEKKLQEDLALVYPNTVSRRDNFSFSPRAHAAGVMAGLRHHLDKLKRHYHLSEK